MTPRAAINSSRLQLEGKDYILLYICSDLHRETAWPGGVNSFMQTRHILPFRDIVAWDCKSFLYAHKVRYVILHSQEHQEIAPEAYERLSAQLRAWMQAPPIYRDSYTTVYAPWRIDSARNYAIILQDGFYGKEYYGDRVFRYTREKSCVRLFLENDTQGFVTFEANSVYRARGLRVMLDGCEIGHCEVPRYRATFHTKPLRLRAGEHELLFLAEGSFRPIDHGVNLDVRDLSICFYKIDWVRLDN